MALGESEWTGGLISVAMRAKAAIEAISAQMGLVEEPANQVKPAKQEEGAGAQAEAGAQIMRAPDDVSLCSNK
jgi:hypothetical protein